MPSNPSAANDRLDADARTFAAQLTALLNGTVTDGLRISAVLRPEELRAYVGYKVSARSVIPDLIPLTLGGKPSCYLGLSVRLQLDPEGLYLTVAASDIGLFLEDDHDQQVLRYDYDRSPSADYPYPAAHLHVYGSNQPLEAWIEQRRDSNALLPKLHLPVGGRRFRPCIEDLIEVLIVEGLVDARPGWRGPLNESRDRWHQLQLMAAVRRDPDAALRALKDMGLV